MTENSQENELVELLDDALKDFKTLQKTTDDDLDEFMQKIDDEATEKAAQKFEEMLNQMAGKIQTENKVTSPSSNIRNSKNGSSNWENTRSVFNDLLLNNGTENDDRKLVEAFANLSFNQGSTNDLMESLIQTAVSKDVMYAPLKEMHSKFGIYLETKKDSLDPELLRNYNEQFRILTRLLQLYAEEESLPSTSTSNEQTKSAKEARATLIANLWIEMQNYGLPPPEITSENNSASSTLNECSII
uniref:Peroxin-19 n=1 Tax=Meloidogyne incognita TaxID=6306 RepID=A0A914N4T1_MELIC